ncbi:hypothetical protein [Pedobacter sp. L105]|uniref:hypothetical protein n=1 Tax=Pedobacter sp. L105 TaxID=1641871 RepID=UPI00131B7173|nr:hypothetical protein [Pedobacter sp. L105]
MNNSIFSSDQDLLNTAELENEFFRPFIKHTEGFKHHEIAYILEIPVDMVKTRIKMAQRVLKYKFSLYQADFKLNLNI